MSEKRQKTPEQPALLWKAGVKLPGSNRRIRNAQGGENTKSPAGTGRLMEEVCLGLPSLAAGRPHN